MKHEDFVSLHVHTEYSLLDGAIRTKELAKTAAEFKMPAVAITDHGNLFGAVEFYKACVDEGVRPIIGCEVYVAPGSRKEKTRTEDHDAAYHLILLARDLEGYRNLVQMVSNAYLEGYYYKPRIDHELLSQHSKGLIGLSACLQGEVPYYLRRMDTKRAREAAMFYSDVLGPENFFLELQENGMAEQVSVNKKLVALSKELNLGIVATNDCHYLKKSDAKAHEILLCIQTGKTISDPNHMRFDGEGYYFRSPQEMKAAFAELPHAILTTRDIAERCNVEFKMGQTKLPRYSPPEGQAPREYMLKLAQEGLKKRFGGHEPPQEYLDRFKMEYEVIAKMGYSSYFLIVWDFINYAKSTGVPVGPGRGSAAGSLVSYALGITEIDPIKYELLFERFLNPERVSMPDIDVDFCKDRRGEIIDYVSKKYGADHVAQIITFGTMAARAAIRDVARAMDFPYAEADKLAKLVPETLKVTLKDALAQEPQLKELYDKDPTVKELLDIAQRLEGLCRHASTHAAGVVISQEPLTNFTPLYRASGEEAVTTQFDMGSAEKMGLIKFDFLGLKTLTVIDKALGYLRERGVELDIATLPLDDKPTFDFLTTGQTTGVFQVESDGMRDILVRMRPSRFEDLIALVALYRPGPIQSGMIDDFIKRKRGEKAITYEVPQLKDILDETYGVIVYQEQVMNISKKLAGFSMGQSDVLRKAMGKKIAEVMQEQRGMFVQGCVKNHIPEKKAEKLFELIEFFGGYGFNKSHSAAYALITYQTAYLKAHYPVEFMAATLSADLDNQDKIVKSIKECRSMGLQVLPPDVNHCGKEFTVSGGAIRFGLAAVKGAGEAACQAILDVRKAGGAFTSIEEYLKRIDGKGVNKKVNESLIKAGAFDSLGQTDGTLQSLGRWRSECMRKVGRPEGGFASLDLFGNPTGDNGEAVSGDEWDEALLIKNEKDALGFYVSGSPLGKYQRGLKAIGVADLADIGPEMDGKEALTAGVVTAIRKLRTKKGDIMAALTIEDDGGWAEVIVFPDLYAKATQLMQKDAHVLVAGKVEVSEKGTKLVAEDVTDIERAIERYSMGKKARISVPGSDKLAALKRMVEDKPGELPLFLAVQTSEGEAMIETAYSMALDDAMIESVEALCGKGAFKLV